MRLARKKFFSPRDHVGYAYIYGVIGLFMLAGLIVALLINGAVENLTLILLCGFHLYMMTYHTVQAKKRR